MLSGSTVAAFTARQAGVNARALRKDGTRIHAGDRVLVLHGDARRILSVERTVLNLLMHLSGVASLTAKAVRSARPLAVLATRKTMPGLRELEKRAVADGGGRPHRRDLSEGILVKNNHLALVPVEIAVARLRRREGPHARVEVEVRSAREAIRAVRAGADAILIDNASPRRARAIVGSIRSAEGSRRVFIELSGGITPENVPRYRATGADAVSLGALTHSAPALRFHLTLRPLSPGHST